MRFRLAVPALGLLVVAALAIAAVRAERSHRVAAERVLRDYAGVGGSELVRRTAFDLGFNGYQEIGAALARGEDLDRLPPRVRGLFEHVYLVDGGAIDGEPPPEWLESWIRADAAALTAESEPFVALHRVIDGRAHTLVLIPLGPGRAGAFEVNLPGLAPYFQRSLDRGPLLPSLVGDGGLGNASLSIAVIDPAGGELLRRGGGPWAEWQAEVPFGDFYRDVLDGSRVRISLDPAAYGHALPGGLPRSQLPVLAALVLLALALTAVAVWQARRERELARLREDFVAGVSHELRTPLAQIRLFTETVLLGRCRSDAEQRRFLEAATRETVRLGHLVDNLLDFSRAGRDRLDVAAAPRRLAPLVAEVTEAFQPLAATRRVRLRHELDPEATAAVDEAGFTRLLLNLLDNAVKYGPEAAEVSVRLQRAGDGVELSVEDRGPGVPARQRRAIFAPFHRLDRDWRSAAAGAGIGLAVVRELAFRHGGSCRVEDREGGGARFVVRLPAVEAA